MKPRRNPNELASEVFDAIMSAGDAGITITGLQSATGANKNAVKKAIQRLRIMFGDDAHNVVCDPNGHNEEWLYRVVNGYERSRDWSANRVEDARTRLKTMRAVMESVTHATDGRSVAGKRSRIIERGLRHVLEDVEAIEVGEL